MQKRGWFFAWVALVLLLAGSSGALAVGAAGAADAMVIAVSDGDTVTVILNGERQRVRLAGIDAPEKKQAFAQRSEQSLRELIWKKAVSIQWRGSDRYGRLLATVRLGELDVGAEQVRRGLAWVYTAYTNDHGLVGLEQAAREDRRGLWADPQPVPPWIWRSMQRDKEKVRWPQ